LQANAFAAKRPPITNDDAYEYIANALPYSEAATDEFGVPTSVIIGVSSHESDWGRSALSATDNNYFGFKCKKDSGYGTIAINCHDYPTQEVANGALHTIVASFRVYKSQQDSIRDYAHLLSTMPRYKTAMTFAANPDQFITEVAKAGYATDPAYATSIITRMSNYDLYDYDLPNSSSGEANSG
jgi:flagellum-specific peptidoglycan hydrolase FlgJ